MNQKVAKLLILAAGMSSRMKKNLEGINLDPKIIEQANNLPKCMIGLGRDGRPFLDYVLFNASKAGIKEVILLLNPKDHFTENYYQKLISEEKNWGLTINFAKQFIPEGREKPLGTTDAIEQALNQFPAWKTSRFIGCNADNLYSETAFSLLVNCEKTNAMLDWDTDNYEESRIRNCAIIKKNKYDFLEDLIEKPSDDEWKIIKETMPRIGISWNIFLFNAPDLIPFIEKTPLHAIRNEKEIPVTVKIWANEKPNDIFTIQISETLPDLTSKNDIANIQAILMDINI